jgi:hypothetical protein
MFRAWNLSQDGMHSLWIADSGRTPSVTTVAAHVSVCQQGNVDLTIRESLLIQHIKQEFVGNLFLKVKL